MKRIFTLLLLFPLCYIVNAQPTFNYALALAPGADNINTTGYSVARDGQGNIYICGTFNNTVNFNPSGSASLTANGTSDAFIAKYNSSGVYQWAFNYGLSGKITSAYKIVADLLGNIYVTGATSSTTAFDVDPSTNTNNITLNGTNYTSTYIIKYDGTQTPSSTSFYQWNFSLGRGISAVSTLYRNYGIAVDNAGYLYVAGNILDESFDFDPSSNTHTLGSSYYGMYVAKYNANVAPSSTSFYQWAKTTSSDAGGSGQIYYGSRGIAVDGSGNVYTVGGFFANDGNNITPPSLTGNTGYVDFSNGIAGSTYKFGTPLNATQNLSMPDGYVVKYNSSGTFQWAFTLSSWDFDWVNDIAADASGNIYITGMFGDYDGPTPNSYTSTVDFDPSSNTHNLTTNGYGAVFVAKYNANYAPSSTSFYQWALKVTGSTSTLATQGNSIAVDPSGYVYVAGQFMNSNVNFDPSGTHNLSSAGGTDGFVARYTGSGAYSYAYTLGGTGTDVGYGINVDLSGNVITTGVFASSNVNFNPSGSNTISAGTGRSIYVAGYTQCDNNFYRWTGGTSIAWGTASNWCGGVVPSSTGVAVIPAGVSSFPTLSSSQTLANLVVQSGSFLNVSAALTLSGNLYNSGTLFAYNPIQTAYDVYNSGTVSGTGAILLNSTVAQNIVGTGTVSNLTINNSNGVTIGAIGTALTVTGTITPSSGTLTTNGNLILASSSNANASIAQGSNTGNYISGNVTVQRYIGSSAQWRMIGFPFTSATTISQATLSGFFSSGYNAYTYNEANDDKTHYGNSGAANAGWTQFTSGTTSSKNGILLKGGTPNSTISFTGPINAGNSSAIISLTKTQNGWNFIANPFPSNINWTSILSNNSSVLNNAIYRYYPNSTAYASYVGGSSTGNQTNVIENGAGFFVQAKTAGSIAIQESDKTTSTAVSLMGNEPAIGTLNPNGSAAPTNTNSIIKLSLAKQGDKYADEVVLRWGVAPDATDKFDGKYDAYDMGRNTGPDLSVIGNDSTVYSIFHGSELKNNTDENRTVQLGIKNMEEGNYTIGIQLLSLIAGNNKAYLYDSYTGVYTLIDGNTNSYGFITTSDMQSQKSTRFSIVLNAKATEADNNNLPVVLLNNPSNNNQFTLFSKSNYNQLQYQVIDNAGRVLNAGMFNNVLKGSVYNINAANAVQGHYFIKLIGNGSLLPTLNAVKN